MTRYTMDADDDRGFAVSVPIASASVQYQSSVPVFSASVQCQCSVPEPSVRD